jgi:two-component system alkaline phosphatase synthesis response regulator PhoP
MARVLVVEDERGIAMALEDDLRGQGHDVDVAADGEAGAALALSQSFDLILLDVMLPKRDGLEVCRQLRSANVRTPIIMLTARTQAADKVLGLETGADDYVTKPYDSSELRARVKAMLRRQSEGLPDTYRFGDVELDFTRREVRKGGRPVPIRPLEFRLLETFVRRRGRALSRQALIDEAWGRGTFVTDRVVDTQIATLRKKIERDPASPQHLLSIRGFGYRFDG